MRKLVRMRHSRPGPQLPASELAHSLSSPRNSYPLDCCRRSQRTLESARAGWPDGDDAGHPRRHRRPSHDRPCGSVRPQARSGLTFGSARAVKCNCCDGDQFPGADVWPSSTGDRSRWLLDDRGITWSAPSPRSGGRTCDVSDLFRGVAGNGRRGAGGRTRRESARLASLVWRLE